MAFSSIIFLSFFLPIFLVLYYLCAAKYKNYFLLLASMVFYAWGAPKFIFVIIGTTILDFYLVRLMHNSREKRKRRLLLFTSVCVNFGLLFYFKYFGFFVENLNALLRACGAESGITLTKIILPVGISFYTFETITYVIDVYRGVHKPLKSFLDYQLYIILFPKLIAGPIVRYHEIAEQISDRSANDTLDFKLAGFYRFCTGLAKKVLVANTLAIVADRVYGNAETSEGMMQAASLSCAQAWIAALAYTFQIYFDFSGYSDMALGLGKMIGFKLPENFDNPYTSQSITEFWRRWHITLGNWMKNYLYIPLGGNQVKSKQRLYFNLCLVFLLSGLWHGASWNFILWGAWHGLFLVLDRMFLVKLTAHIGKAGRIIFTFFIVTLGWVVFRVENISTAFSYLKTMFTGGAETTELLYDGEMITMFCLAIFFSFFCVFSNTQKIGEAFYAGKFRSPAHFTLTVLSLLLMFISLSYLAADNFNPFIYFRF